MVGGWWLDDLVLKLTQPVLGLDLMLSLAINMVMRIKAWKVYSKIKNPLYEDCASKRSRNSIDLILVS